MYLNEGQTQKLDGTDNPPLDSASAALAELRAEVYACRRCAEAGYFVGRAVVGGRRPSRVMLVGQAPSLAGAEQDRPFAWREGRPRPKLWDWLEEAGWTEDEFRATAYMTAVTRCYPGPARSGQGDRRPSAVEVRLCAPYLDRELALVDPDLIILLGAAAVERILGKVRLDDVIGQTLDREIAGRTRVILPLPHPSGVSRWHNDPANGARLREALATLRGLRERLLL
ncbi:MAG: uracil-DNA glycosylase family protein [Anaerolineae bacterium]